MSKCPDCLQPVNPHDSNCPTCGRELVSRIRPGGPRGPTVAGPRFPSFGWPTTVVGVLFLLAGIGGIFDAVATFTKGGSDPASTLGLALGMAISALASLAGGIGLVRKDDWGWWIATGISGFGLAMTPAVAVADAGWSSALESAGVWTVFLLLLLLPGLRRRAGDSVPAGMPVSTGFAGPPLPPPPSAHRTASGVKWGALGLVIVVALASVVYVAARSNRTALRASGASPAGVSAEAYATALCSGLNTWVSDVNAIAASMAKPTTLRQLKSETISYLDQVIAATDKLIATHDAAGVPGVEGGREAAQADHATFVAVKGVFVQAQNQVKGFSTKDPAAFRAEMRTVVMTMQSTAQRAAFPLQSGGPELERAFAANPTCRTFAGGLRPGP